MLGGYTLRGGTRGNARRGHILVYRECIYTRCYGNKKWITQKQAGGISMAVAIGG